MKTATVSLRAGDCRASGDGEAWVPALEKVGYSECVGKGEVGEGGGGVIDEEAEGVGHAWEKEGGEAEERGGEGESRGRDMTS